jgi:DNA-binding winged helix-turn-helix (wHTH) protein
MMLERPGEVLTREEICRELWPEGTFVDYEHGVNSAVNRLREALGDSAASPRFVETLARKGYRFVAPVERVGESAELAASAGAERNDGSLRSRSLPATSSWASTSQSRDAGHAAEVEERGLLDGVLASEEDLPRSSHAVVKTLFVLLQLMYLAFYVGALANLAEIAELLSPLSYARAAFDVVAATAAVLIPVRVFVVCVVLFRAPRARGKLLRMWPLVMAMDLVWALSPALLLHHISAGLAIACMTLLVYSPLAQRSLVLMGAAQE